MFGLKENVILGRRIPVGTGYRTEEQLAEEAAENRAREEENNSRDRRFDSREG